MMNCNRVFYNQGSEDFLSELNVPESEQKELAKARDLIRRKLSLGFSKWQEVLDRGAILSEEAILKSLGDPSLRPKFKMQGSASYQTLNDPAHQPPQQIDYDDGVYLPVSFLKDSNDPILASSGYFALVEAILLPLCRKYGWKLQTHKDSCVRVELHKKSHIDLPLYAILDEQFSLLVENVSILKSSVERQALKESQVLDESVYSRFDTENIQLAHRTEGWILSDPRLIENWFGDAIKSHGQQLRRVCRYLKAWRDFHWKESKKSKLSSLALMKCTIDAFDSIKGTVDDKRDDIATLEVARKLSSYFEHDILNPVIEGVLNEGWSQNDRRMYQDKATELAQRLESAIRGTYSSENAIAELIASFGSRIPNDPSLVALTTEAAIRSFRATKVPAPEVPRTRSG